MRGEWNDLEERPRRRPARGRRRRSNSGAWVVGLVLGLLGVLLVGGGVVLVAWKPRGKRAADSSPAASSSVPPGWTEVSSAEGRFRVLFPGSPTLRHRTQPSPVGPVHDTAYLLDLGDRSLMVSFADFTGPGQMRADLMQVVRAGRDAVMQKARGALSRDRDITLNGHPGKDVAIDTAQQGTVYLRWYVVNRRLYALAFMGTRTTPPADEVDRFFSSFRLNP